MASEPVAGFPSIDRAIRNYVHLEIDERALSLTAPRAIDLERSFVDFLVSRGVLEFRASELYVEHGGNVIRQAGLAADAWKEIGEERPYAQMADEPARLISWRSPSFAELTGHAPIAEEFAAAYDWMRRNVGTAFLLPALCYLRALGCDRIFLCDGPDDEGVDCIGRIATGPLRSLAVFVQAKSSADFVTGDQFSAMQTRYSALPSTRMFRRYLEVLEVTRSSEGAGFLFVVAAQGRFKDGARHLAWKTGTLLRSGRALAHTLASYYPMGSLDAIAQTFELPQGSDLERNLAPELARP